jgi:acyl-CoA thioesterase-1
MPTLPRGFCRFWPLLLALLVRPGVIWADDIRSVVFLGDSLTYGYGLDDPSTQAYPALIAARIAAAGLPWRVVNASVSGDTTADGLARLNWVLRQRIDVLVLALGANDGLRGLDPNLTRQNLEAAIDRVRSRYPQVEIVLAGMGMPASLGPDYVAAFAATFPRVARERRVQLIPFLLAGVGGRPELNQADGIHPTAAGAVIVAETVWRALRPILIRPSARRVRPGCIPWKSAELRSVIDWTRARSVAKLPT